MGAAVVLWGHRVANVPGGAVDVDGVTVCVGRQYREWRRRLHAEPLTGWQVDAVAELVHGYVALTTPARAWVGPEDVLAVPTGCSLSR